MFPNNGIGILSSKDVIIPISVSPFLTHLIGYPTKFHARLYLLSKIIPELFVALINGLVNGEHHTFFFRSFIHKQYIGFLSMNWKGFIHVHLHEIT